MLAFVCMHVCVYSTYTYVCVCVCVTCRAFSPQLLQHCNDFALSRRPIRRWVENDRKVTEDTGRWLYRGEGGGGGDNGSGSDSACGGSVGGCKSGCGGCDAAESADGASGGFGCEERRFRYRFEGVVVVGEARDGCYKGCFAGREVIKGEPA